MKWSSFLFVIGMMSFGIFSGIYADELSPAVPVVPNIAPPPALAPAPTATSLIPGNLESMASSCHIDLNQNATPDTDLQQFLVSNDPGQAVSVLNSTPSCRAFAEKAVLTFVILNPRTNTILRGGVELNSPLTAPGPAFPTQICQAMCTYSCRPSVGIIFALAAQSHQCIPCAKIHPCSPVSGL